MVGNANTDEDCERMKTIVREQLMRRIAFFALCSLHGSEVKMDNASCPHTHTHSHTREANTIHSGLLDYLRRGDRS